MEIINTINFIIGIIFTVCYAYQFMYIPVPWLFHRKNKREAKRNSFAILICGRNESAVIGDLIDSINAQTYDKSLITTFVMADNCTDNTAEIAKAHGAVVYTRFNKELIGKGYALKELLTHIKEDYPAGFDAFIVFDADNIIAPNYIEEMNKTFSQGHDVITSFRNSKNYGANWISAGYALWFLRESRYLNQARYTLHTSCAVSGTGFLFSRKIAEEIKDWPFHMLTEDIEFSVYNIVNGRKIAFCKDAELFDEQPVKFSQSWRQRLRWSKGYLQVFGGYGTRLIKGALSGLFSCYDMAMTIMPAFILSTIAIVLNMIVFFVGCFTGHAGEMLESSLKGLGAVYFMLFMVGGITTVTEWKRIQTSAFKKILYAFTFPLFMFTYVPISIHAFFAKCEWKPIEHTMSVNKIKADAEKSTRKEKSLRVALAIVAVIIVISIGWINAYIRSYANRLTITPVQAAENTSTDYVVVFTAENGDKKTCEVMLGDRFARACELLKTNNNSHLLIVDDRPVSEKENMPFDASQYEALAELPKELYTVDTETASTFDAMKHIQSEYEAERIIIVAPKCRLSRVLYVANEMGMEAYGLPAEADDSVEYDGQLYREWAEIFANVRDFTFTVVDSVVTPAAEPTNIPDARPLTAPNKTDESIPSFTFIKTSWTK